jgi:polyisoprenyl-teichoic acid--peptidoglycan teichoic acid transferase
VSSVNSKNHHFVSSQDPSEYSRNNSKTRYNSKKLKSKKKKRIVIASTIIGVIVALVIGVFVAMATIFGGMNWGMNNIGLVSTQYADQPFYMVLMGIDSSDERKSEGSGSSDEDFRSDSMILCRVDPKSKKVTMLSIHRDIEVDMGEHGTQKINAAHSLGGPELVIKAVSNLTGLDINHYAEINFDGFKAAVDSLGGVEMNVPMEIADPYAGYVPAGNVTLNGDMALALARSRHSYDDYGDGDKFRAANQRSLLSAIAKKALNSDVVTIANTVTSLAQYIKTDFGLNDMIGLLQLFKGINPDKDIYSAMTPTEGVYKDGGWYEQLDKTKFKKMIDRMEQGLPPSEETVIDESTGAVLSSAGDGGSSSSSSSNSGSSKLSGSIAVRNGTTKEGKAAVASASLAALGFSTSVGNANSLDYTQTIVVYSEDSQKSTAEAIRDNLGCGQVIKNNGEYIFTSDYLVVVGTDYNG